ncbi:hypothetical protein FRC06_000542 [Ceratobasidium sp. 370]|nr:hypothetical protein FRC06_000542 [Ceratobasidium sp. 370]
MLVAKREGLGDVGADEPMSSRRFASVRMEEVEDEDMPNIPLWGRNSPAPASPRRFPSPTLGDMEDEDMLDASPCGPHPLATPTCPSLFPEPHNDPTAGVAFYFYEVPVAKPPLYETKLTDPETFVEANWIANLECSQRAKNPYFTLPRSTAYLMAHDGTGGHYESQATKAT